MLAGFDGVTAGAGTAIVGWSTLTGAVVSAPTPPPMGADPVATSLVPPDTGTVSDEPVPPLVSTAAELVSEVLPCVVVSELSSGALSTTRSVGPVGRMATATRLSVTMPETSTL